MKWFSSSVAETHAGGHQVHHEEGTTEDPESARQGDQDPEGAHRAAPRECGGSAGLQGVPGLRQPGHGGEFAIKPQ